MNLFDGGFRSKPVINYAGSRRTKTTEDLLREVNNERNKRENEKKQLSASIKIQSAYRSYLVRKKIQDEYRREFDTYLASKSDSLIEQNISYLLTIFVKFYRLKHDKDRLVKFNPIIMKHKTALLKSIENTQNGSISLPKFLVIQLRFLNCPDSSSAQSSSLRIIDYFTDSTVYEHNQPLSFLVFNYLINNGYIKELVDFSMIKIPSSVSTVIPPIALSLAQLFYRCFMYLRSSNDQDQEFNSPGTSYNKSLIDSLSNELFARSSVPQIKCIVKSLAQIIEDNDGNLNKLFEFLIIYGRTLEANVNSASIEFNNYTLDCLKNNLSRLYCLTNLIFRRFDKFPLDKFIEFLRILRLILTQIPVLNVDSSCDETSAMDELDDEQTRMQVDNNDEHQSSSLDLTVVREILRIFDSRQLTDKIESSLVEVANNESTLRDVCLSVSYICNFVLLNSRVKIHKTLLLRRLAFNKLFLTNLWHLIGSLTIGLQLKQDIYLLKMLANGSIPEVYENESMKIVAPLSTFCSLYNLFLLPILDEEFLRGEAIFSKMDLIKMSAYLKDACFGIITLMHPEAYHSSPLTSNASSGSLTKPSNHHHHHHERSYSSGQSAHETQTNLLKLKCKAKYFTHLFQACSQLVQRMFIRDIRFGFCPENHWLSTIRFTTIDRLSSILELNQEIFLSRIRFGQMSYLFIEEIENEIKLSLNEIRALTVLQELPFSIPFEDRVKILESFTNNVEMGFGPNLHKIRIRRNYLYEDAFDNLSLENVPNFSTSRVQVEMINEHGLDEAGIDGGGVFREFILKLLETGFDPNRGFFSLTSDGFLYPNPNVSMFMENSRDHYTFLGRMLAKAIQLKILSPLKFASFFLQKILSKTNATRLDIDYLASLDPDVYKNLIMLKDPSCNVQDLELNFAVDLNELGQTKLVELKPGGRDIPVTNDNKIEYIHLLADYKLNRQIHEQVIAFRRGIASVVNTDVLRMFNFNEFQNLISGCDETIDVTDWRFNTAYSGVYSSDHSVIQTFWAIVEEMSEPQKRKLLKFATSRSRPPLFGFKNLIPNFAIQSSDSDRLPTASTCLNLLKLPTIEDYDVLKEKILCAIESDAGFELS